MLKVYIVHKQRRLFLCAVFVPSSTTECTQTVGTWQWNSGGCYMWRIVSCM